MTKDYARTATTSTGTRSVTADNHHSVKPEQSADSVRAAHGTYARYQRSGGACRCELCQAANREYTRQYRWRTGRNQPHETYVASLREARTHGTGPMYKTAGCRCAECNAWNRGFTAGYRYGKKDRMQNDRSGAP
jgi:hypothetical protein